MREYGKAEAAHQAQHFVVVREDVADHAAVGFFPRAIDDRSHQAATKAALLPFVADGQRKLDGFAIRGLGVAGAADLAFAAFLLNDGEQNHFPVVIDLGEADDQAGWKFARAVHETELA